MKHFSEQALEAIARKLIKDFDELLYIGTPKAIPIEEIIEKHLKINVEYYCIRKNGRILGETVFADTFVPVFDKEAKEYILMFIKAKTIILDESLLDYKYLGRLRFTCAHELAHWIIHKELYLNKGETAALEKSMLSSATDNKIEQQANMLATAILMPMKQVKKAFYQLRGGSTENTISKMAELFQVSKQAMEIRLRNHKLI